jgi:hypothetical protein
MATDFPANCEIQKACAMCGATSERWLCMGTRKRLLVEHSQWCEEKHTHYSKRVCFLPGAVCTRCNEPVAQSSPPGCRVLHPPHLVKSGGMLIAGDNSAFWFSCAACRACFTRTGNMLSNDSVGKISSFPITKGSEWCYEATHHTVEPIMDSMDHQRVFRDLVVISPPNVQDQIDAIDETTIKVLKIYADGPMIDTIAVNKPKLTRNFPKLEELTIENVDFATIQLTNANTPKLNRVSFEGVSEKCEIDVRLPCLKSLSIYYHDGHDWIEKTLEAATKLVSFDSYKLCRVGSLGFYSNDLESIRLCRAECLSKLDLWAPTLEKLDIQGCYDLSSIIFLDKHPLKAKLSANFYFDEELQVKVDNAILGNEAKRALMEHPRTEDLTFDFKDHN